MITNFEEFLRSTLDLGHTQVKMVARVCEHGKVHFYAVGQCGATSSETFDAIVEGKHVRHVGEEKTFTPTKKTTKRFGW